MPIRALPINYTAIIEQLTVMRAQQHRARHWPAAGWLVIGFSALTLVVAQHGWAARLPAVAIVLTTGLMITLAYLGRPHWRAAGRACCMFGLVCTVLGIFFVLPIYTRSISPHLPLRGWWWFLALPILAALPAGLLWALWNAQRRENEMAELKARMEPLTPSPRRPPRPAPPKPILPDDLDGHDVTRWDEAQR